MNTFFKNLCNEMNARRFLANNPVLGLASQFKADHLEAVVGQYVGLVTMITSYLFVASVRLGKIPAARDELVRNMGEERGSLTGGLTHHEILNRELMKLGVKVNLATWDEPTREFLAALNQLITIGPSEAYVAGVVYALEATATPELKVVGQLLNKYAQKRGLAAVVSAEALAGTATITATTADGLSLSDFFAIHIESFEPGHRDRFAEAMSPEIMYDVSKQMWFATGFRTVLDLMDIWWERLAIGD